MQMRKWRWFRYLVNLNWLYSEEDELVRVDCEMMMMLRLSALHDPEKQSDEDETKYGCYDDEGADWKA